MPEALRDILIRRIRRTGPMTVAEYMAEALHHRGQGYYVGGDPIGAGGDFVTAPEISQMFGEILGLWMVNQWMAEGSPRQACLVELGPGRGTLMADMVRVIQGAVPDPDAFEIHLVESNPTLRAAQARALPDRDPVWHDDLSTLPDRPWFLVANEFLDALPIHQLVWSDGAWRQTLVVLDPAGDGLAWGIDRAPAPMASQLPDAIRETAREGAIAELCPAASALITAISSHLAQHGGAALLADYGDERQAGGGSLQAVRNHAPVDPLQDPGLADLSSHVDFSAIRDAALTGGGGFHGPVAQGAFLETIGIRHRAASLARSATPAQRAEIEKSLHRLIDPREMGTLFKVAAVTAPATPVPAGFE